MGSSPHPVDETYKKEAETLWVPRQRKFNPDKSACKVKATVLRDHNDVFMVDSLH